MERGLLWLPLLAVFIWLAWMGQTEYQKLEAYRHWAEQFERSKYDIYAVLGQKETTLTWGKPTRSGPVGLQSFSLAEIAQIRLLVNQQPVSLDSPPSKGSASLEFIRTQTAEAIQIPFTEVELAVQWGQYLQAQHQALKTSERFSNDQTGDDPEFSG